MYVFLLLLYEMSKGFNFRQGNNDEPETDVHFSTFLSARTYGIATKLTGKSSSSILIKHHGHI